jgi:hypothetical protein
MKVHKTYTTQFKLFLHTWKRHDTFESLVFRLFMLMLCLPGLLNITRGPDGNCLINVCVFVFTFIMTTSLSEDVSRKIINGSFLETTNLYGHYIIENLVILPEIRMHWSLFSSLSKW